jgi:hypothetical protein
MTVPVNVVEVQVNDVAEGVPETVGLQSYDPAWISVRYGDESKELAVVNTDYTVDISEDWEEVTITPTASLMIKIGDLGEDNVIYIRRDLPMTTDVTENDVQFREKIVEQFDKCIMLIQQLYFYIYEAASEAAASALAAAASAAAAAVSEAASLASSVASAASAALSQGYAAAALVYRDMAAAYAISASVKQWYTTNEAMQAALGSWVNGDNVGVWADETRGGVISVYQRVGGAWVWQASPFSSSSGGNFIYVNSAAADDTANGYTSATPKKTLAAAVALLGTGSKLILMPNSHWREQIVLTGKTDISIETLPGVRPIVSAEQLITAFTINGAGPAYTFTIDLAAIVAARGYAGVFEDGVRLREYKVGDVGIADAAAAIAAVEANPGSFYFAGPGTHLAGWSAGTKTYYVHASGGGDPGSNGKVYEAYKYDFTATGGTGTRTKGIRFHLGFHHDGGGGQTQDCSFERIARHGSLPSVPSMREIVMVGDNPAHPGGAFFHSNPSTLVADAMYDRCIAVGDDRFGTLGIAGWYSHGGPSTIRNKATLKNCEAYNLSIVLNIGNVTNIIVEGLKARKFTSFLFMSGNILLRNVDARGGTGGAGDGGRHFTYGSTAVIQVLKSYLDLMAASFIFSSSGLLGSISFDYCTLIMRDSTGNFFYSNSASDVTKVHLTNSIVYCLRRYIGGHPETLLQAAGDILDLNVANVLFIGLISSTGTPTQDPSVVVDGITTTLGALLGYGWNDSVFFISADKAVMSDKPDLVLKYGVYSPGDIIFSACAQSPNSEQPRRTIMVGSRIMQGAGEGYIPTTLLSGVPTSHLRAACWVNTAGNNRFVAVGDDGLIMYSDTAAPDSNWSVATSGTTEHLYGVCADASGVVVAVGANGTVLRSTDAGVTWAAAAVPGTTRTMRGVATEGTNWIAAGNDGRVIRSTDDGDNWSEATVGTQIFYAVFRSEIASLFILGAHAGELRTSTDGAAWTQRTNPSTNRVVAFAEADGNVWAGMRQTSRYPETFVKSTNGTAWTLDPATLPFEIRGMCGPGATSFTADRVVACGEAQSVGFVRAGAPWRVDRIRLPVATEENMTTAEWVNRVS